MGTRRNVLSFVGDMAIYIFLLSDMKYTCVVFDKPLNVSWKLFLKTSHFTSLERSFSGLQDSSVLWWQHFFRNMHLFLSFLSFYFLHYLHYHFVCQYKRRNCSQMISGWYLTLSCLSLVCSATFLTVSLPSHFISIFLMHWHYS